MYEGTREGEKLDIAAVLAIPVEALMATLVMIEVVAVDILVGVIGAPLHPQMKMATAHAESIAEDLEEVQIGEVVAEVAAVNVLGVDEISILTAIRQTQTTTLRNQSQQTMVVVVVAAAPVSIAGLVIPVGDDQDFHESIFRKFLVT